MANAQLFQFQWKTKLQELIKMEKKLQKPCPTDYNLLIAQDLWLYQILLIILLREFMKINANTNTMILMIENVNFAVLNTKIATAFLHNQL